MGNAAPTPVERACKAIESAIYEDKAHIISDTLLHLRDTERPSCFLYKGYDGAGFVHLVSLLYSQSHEGQFACGFLPSLSLLHITSRPSISVFPSFFKLIVLSLLDGVLILGGANSASSNPLYLYLYYVYATLSFFSLPPLPTVL